MAKAADCELLQLEVNQAFSPKKNKKFRANMRDLEWMYEQCSSGELFQLYSGDRSKLTLFDMQTYRQWKSHIEYERVVNFRRLRQKTIFIQPLVLSPDEQEKSGYESTEIYQPVLDLLRFYCESFFTGMTVTIASPIDISTIKKVTKRVHTKTNREQFLVGDLLKYLKSICPKSAFSMVGVTMVDIYPGPEWNFVLGQASITTGCGVFSFGRFFKTSPHAERKVAESCQIKEMWILIRVMTHELCHIFGIKHCYYFQCSLNESSSISEAATQPLFVCPICLKKLRKSLQFHTLERYKILLDATREIQRAVCEALQVHFPANEHSPTPSPGLMTGEGGAPLGIGSETGESETNRQSGEPPSSIRDQAADKSASDASPCGTLHHHPGKLSNGITSSDDQLMSSLPRELWHSEQLEYFSKAIGWLERTIANLEQFEIKWTERKILANGKK